MQHYGSARLQDAQALCQQILSGQPAFVPALCMMGMIEMRLGRMESALELLRQAVALQPGYADAHGNLGIVLTQAKRLDEAIAAFERAVYLAPGVASHYSNLANVLTETESFKRAIDAYRKAIAIDPRPAGVYYRLSVALRKAGHYDQAVAAARHAILLNPNHAESYNTLGSALVEQELLSEAANAYQKAIALQPNVPGFYSNLGRVYHKQRNYDDAVALARRSIAMKTDFAEAYRLLGDALREQGRIDEAMDAYEQSLKIEPDHSETLGNRAFTMLYQPGRDSAAQLEAARLWASRCADHLQPIETSADDHRPPGQRLRIGYVSADFRRHAAASFLLPLLRNHDGQRFDVVCYSSVRQPDAITAQMRQLAADWRDVLHLSDGELAEQIRADRVDILVDLSQHTSGKRLLAFARKPAPVQVAWLGYPGTTGLRTMDYRLTDPHLDPPGTDSFYTERSLRLPHCFWCYEPPCSPEVSELPARADSPITFGCLNTFRKINPPVLRAWCQLLRRVPNARLLLHAGQGSHRQRMLDLLRDNGVDPARLDFVEQAPTEDYFRLYNRIDIALDPFPFAGGTTTCDALWMGVPVIAKVGQTAVGRSSLSILTNIGLAELAASEIEQYIELAAALAGDRDRLRDLRQTLRERMRQSLLMDAPRFARDMEAAYFHMAKRTRD